MIENENEQCTSPQEPSSAVVARPEGVYFTLANGIKIPEFPSRNEMVEHKLFRRSQASHLKSYQ